MVFDWLRDGHYSLFEWVRPDKVWRLYANVSGLLASGLLFAMVLAGLTSGTGAVFKVDGPATSDRLEVRSGVMTMRVPLGGRIEFDMPWHVVEGGCERYMTRTFSRLSLDEPYLLSSRRRAPSHAVGRPGTDHVDAELPSGISPGIWRYTLTASAVCPQLGRKAPDVEFTAFDVDVFEADGPVLKPLAGPILASPVIPRGGPVAYRFSWERFDGTPSETYNTYSSVGPGTGGTPDVVIERRPSLNRPAGKHIHVDFTVPLPAAVGPGRWRQKQIAISTRPGGHTRIDPLFEIEFEVAK